MKNDVGVRIHFYAFVCHSNSLALHINYKEFKMSVIYLTYRDIYLNFFLFQLNEVGKINMTGLNLDEVIALFLSHVKKDEALSTCR